MNNIDNKITHLKIQQHGGAQSRCCKMKGSRVKNPFAARHSNRIKATEHQTAVIYLSLPFFLYYPSKSDAVSYKIDSAEPHSVWGVVPVSVLRWSCFTWFKIAGPHRWDQLQRSMYIKIKVSEMRSDHPSVYPNLLPSSQSIRNNNVNWRKLSIRHTREKCVFLGMG